MFFKYRKRVAIQIQDTQIPDSSNYRTFVSGYSDAILMYELFGPKYQIPPITGLL